MGGMGWDPQEPLLPSQRALEATCQLHFAQTWGSLSIRKMPPPPHTQVAGLPLGDRGCLLVREPLKSTHP